MKLFAMVLATSTILLLSLVMWNADGHAQDVPPEDAVIQTDTPPADATVESETPPPAVNEQAQEEFEPTPPSDPVPPSGSQRARQILDEAVGPPIQVAPDTTNGPTCCVVPKTRHRIVRPCNQVRPVSRIRHGVHRNLGLFKRARAHRRCR